MSLFDIFNNNAQQQAAGAQIQGINAGVQQALPNYQTGIQQLQQYGGQALSPLYQNFGTLTGGSNALGNLLGLGGAAGTQSALNTLTSMPGYQFTVNQGNNAILAQNAATGGTGSGNEALALQRFGQNAAQQNYNNYVSQLQPYLTGIQNTGGQIAGTNMGIGTGVQGGYNNIGNMLYGANTSIGNANANAALGNLTGSGNLWGLGTNLAAGLLSFSDVKLKEDIAPVGVLASGETVYRYRMKGSPRVELGLMAQELEHTVPEAVYEVLPDLRAVDYRHATERAAKILEFTRMRHEPTPTHRPYGQELMELAA